MGYDPYQMYKPTFGIGTRVKVVRQVKYQSEKLLGLEGTVQSDSGSNVGVMLDGLRNARSSYGCFYFKPVDLVAVDECSKEIKEEKNMSKITNYLNIAKIKFIGECSSSEYAYANFDPDLKVGDFCVATAGSKFINAKLAKVAEIIESNEVETDREIVAKVYTEAYDRRNELRAKAADLKAKMEARAKQLQDIALYQMLAKDDPDMAYLLKEYQNIPTI